MSMKRVTVILLALALCLSLVLLAGCGGSAPAKDEKAGAGENGNKPTKVALLLPGPFADGGWNTLAYRGIEALAKDPQDFAASYTENVKQADIQSVTAGYCEEGYDLIIGHGFEFGTAYMDLAPKYPNVKFFVTGQAPQGVEIPPNLMFFWVGGEGEYVNGALAALLSKTHKVGFVGGGDNPTQRGWANAFKQGAEETVPGTQVMIMITGDYNDASRGREAAVTMMNNGADVITHAADVTGLGVIAAVAETKNVAIGCYSDQIMMAHDRMATSLTEDLAWVVQEVAKSVREGKFQGGQEWHPEWWNVWKFKAADKEFNESIVSEEVAKKVAEIREKVKNGEIKVPWNTK
ncbi:MAG TPA: BMP family ABC transporter substrate-binding protein [Firmicutes bacterium]|nr:BMP family ABC transporter substrate-binding protein [Bacillota bacterium]